MASPATKGGILDRQNNADRQGGGKQHCFLESRVVWSWQGGTDGERQDRQAVASQAELAAQNSTGSVMDSLPQSL